MRGTARSLLAAAAVVATVGAVGCSSTLDTPGLEAQIAGQLGARLNTPANTVTWDVSCPQGIEPKQGDTFTCTAKGTDSATGDTRSVTLDVTQSDDQGHVRWQIAGGG